MIGVVDLIAGIFKPAAELIDNLHTSTDEKNKHKERLLGVQAAAMQTVFDYERASLEGQQKIVQAEAQSEHWIVASWRPITMLTFLGLAVGDTFGLFATPLRDEAWTLLQLGIGGYVVGRSGEKIVKEIKHGR
jgi:hypothetical protein